MGEDMHAQDLIGVCIHNELRKPTCFAHCARTPNGPHRILADLDPAALGLSFFSGRSHAGDLGIRKYSARNPAGVILSGFSPQRVPDGDSRRVDGKVGVLQPAQNITDSPNVRSRCAEGFVDSNSLVRVAFYPSAFEAELSEMVRPSSRGDKDPISLDALLLPGHCRRHGDAAACELFDPGRDGAGEDSDAFLSEDHFQFPGYLFVFPWEHAIPALEDRHLHPEPVEDLPELHALRSAAEDDHGPGQRFHVHDRLIGEEPGLLQARDIGNIGCNSGRDDHPLRVNAAIADIQPARTGEPGPAPNEVDPWILLEAALGTRNNRVDDRVFALPNARPVDLQSRGAEPKLRAPPGRVDGLRRPYQGLGGDTPHVDSGAPEPAAFDQGDLRPHRGGAIRCAEPAHSPADDYEVVDRHCISLLTLCDTVPRMHVPSTRVIRRTGSNYLRRGLRARMDTCSAICWVPGGFPSSKVATPWTCGGHRAEGQPESAGRESDG